jgi:hypothetical protein
VENIWKRFKEIIFENIDRSVPHKILRKNPDSEYYKKEVKRLEAKVRRIYNKRILDERYKVELNTLSKQLLAAKQTVQQTFLRSVLSNKDNCWSEFYKYVKRRKGNRENIPAIKDSNGTIITDSTEKANISTPIMRPFLVAIRASLI